LSVPEAIFRRESLPLSMHGCIKRMTIKLTPFSVRPYTAAHFCGASTHTPGQSSPHIFAVHHKFVDR
jgi:hypothetical protein